MKFNFIVIDDSELDCFIVRKIIRHLHKDSTVTTFQQAQQGLSAVWESAGKSSPLFTIIFLDLQMPLMDGFQFAEEFDKLPADVRKNYTIIVLSSTKNANDITQILTYDSVDGMLEKPLTKEKLSVLLEEIKEKRNDLL